MAADAFFTVLKMNFTASFVALLLILIKLILTKIGCPRKILFFLWVIVAVRLVCPVMPASQMSPLNLIKVFGRTEVRISEKNNFSAYESVYYANSGKEPKAGESGNSNEEPFKLNTGAWMSGVWIAGCLLMLAAGVISYYRIKRRLRYAVKLKDNIYISDKISTSFVFGMIIPRIYLSERADKQDYDYIIIHEQTHVKRFDHFWKIVAYVLLSVHWFNPFNWLLFKMFAAEMELSCDEAVIEKVGFENKIHYIEAIIRSASNAKKNVYNAYFSANPIKKRIYNVIKAKRCPKFFYAAAFFLCALIIAMLCTDATSSYRAATDFYEVRFESEADESKERRELKTVADNTFSAETNGVAEQIETSFEEITERKDYSENPIKSSTVAEEPYAGFELLEINEISIPYIYRELINRGIADEKSTDLKESFCVREYSYEDNLECKIEDVKCDENGNISLYFELNSENVTEVKFYDSQTGENVCSYHVLTGSENVYSFLGFDENTTYDIEIAGNTQGEWMIEGKYIVY